MTIPLKPVYSGDTLVGVGEFQAGDQIPKEYLEHDDTPVATVPGYNYLINPCFEINQRVNTSMTANNGFPADRWKINVTGSTVVASQQSFTLGQTDVPGEPKNFLRTIVTSVAGVDNLCLIKQPIESVRSLAGKTVTLSFKGKADAAKPIAVEFVQVFGSGGSPSVSVTGIGSTKLNLTSSWSNQKVTVDIPSIAGKTLGTNGDDCLVVIFWFDAGSDFNSRTGSLGQQSGTFDIANVKLEEGSVATPCIVPRIDKELLKCMRFYEKSYNLSVAPGTATPVGSCGPVFQTGADTTGYLGSKSGFCVLKRTTPTIAIYDLSGNLGKISTHSQNGTPTNNVSSSALYGIGQSGFSLYKYQLSGCSIEYHYTADAEL